MLGRLAAWLTSMVVGSAEASKAPQWDARAGVWVGGKAGSGSGVETPDPLWIFGYGSLCWRPDFPHEETMVCRVSGWGRYFAQSSCDHRGTPDSPGLVATLLEDGELAARGLRDASLPPSTTCGLAYRVGPADVDSVLENLDVREKGGYTRAVVTVYPAGSDAQRAPVSALIYSATPDNPNFAPSALSDLPGAAHTIAGAHGPSGANREYLEKLAQWLDKVGETDEHVASLMRHLPPR